ncbi:P-loop containing nucleoside triphosphate hydrolase protein [Xylaria cubensis]|nr:P-loop containing nucleoside triphosphate hydrolase protein [Xylaria cubensis]
MNALRANPDLITQTMESHEHESQSSSSVPETYNGANTSKISKRTEPARIKLITKSAGRVSMAGKKRKSDRPASSSSRGQNKRRNPGPRKLNVRKDRLGNQLINLALRKPNQNSEDLEYTPEQRKSEKAELEEAILVFGPKIEREEQEQDCPNDLFRVRGMLTAIPDYQAVGAAFMLRQERSRKSNDQMDKSHNGCRGGILADDMGVGKTVQTIACMLANPPSLRAKSALQGATLIVVPSQGLVKQWTEELLRHANVPEDEVLISQLAFIANSLRLTTYKQLEGEFRSNSSNAKKSSGPLFQIEFYRVVLDEGDRIKNHRGSTSKACCELKAKLKWVLSGTPLRNNLKECLPYFRFLGIDVKEKWEEFIKKWKEPKSKKLDDRIMQILVHVMFRREAGQRFLERKICELPKSCINNRYLSITAEETAIYKHLEQGMIRREVEARQKAKDAKEADGPKSNYWVRCNRLRQAVDHPFLLEKCIRDILTKDEIRSLIAELQQIKISKTKVKNKASSSDGLPLAQPEEASVSQLADDMISHLEDLLPSHDNDGCHECSSVSELQSLVCGHIMCRTCYQNCVDNAFQDDKKQCNCPQCGKVFAKIKEESDNKQLNREEPVKIKRESIQISDGRGVSIIPKHERSQPSPGDDYNGMQPQMERSRWLEKCDKLGKITSSTKTTTAFNMVEESLKEAPDDKIVLFTEWIGTAIILGRMLNRANIEFVYYSGPISVKGRDKNLDDFRNNPVIKVMISTMAAGSVGLNITAANRMIIMNPWWNYAAEIQAFGRLKRHGQVKETYMDRLFAMGTIDERIRILQKRKTSEIREAMEQGQKPKLLSQDEIRWLTGDRDTLESPFDESGDETLEADDSDLSE